MCCLSLCQGGKLDIPSLRFRCHQKCDVKSNYIRENRSTNVCIEMVEWELLNDTEREYRIRRALSAETKGLFPLAWSVCPPPASGISVPITGGVMRKYVFSKLNKFFTFFNTRKYPHYRSRCPVQLPLYGNIIKEARKALLIISPNPVKWPNMKHLNMARPDSTLRNIWGWPGVAPQAGSFAVALVLHTLLWGSQSQVHPHPQFEVHSSGCSWGDKHHQQVAVTPESL